MPQRRLMEPDTPCGSSSHHRITLQFQALTIPLGGTVRAARRGQRPQFPAAPSVAAGAGSVAAVSPSACAAPSQSALISIAPT